jgi:hypothetical protein
MPTTYSLVNSTGRTERRNFPHALRTAITIANSKQTPVRILAHTQDDDVEILVVEPTGNAGDSGVVHLNDMIDFSVLEEGDG